MHVWVRITGPRENKKENKTKCGHKEVTGERPTSWQDAGVGALRLPRQEDGKLTAHPPSRAQWPRTGKGTSSWQGWDYRDLAIQDQPDGLLALHLKESNSLPSGRQG